MVAWARLAREGKVQRSEALDNSLKRKGEIAILAPPNARLQRGANQGNTRDSVPNAAASVTQFSVEVLGGDLTQTLLR